MIYELDWGAIATAGTGVAAVLAALVVASKQTRLAERQLDIAAAQHAASLFDRRFSVFSATEAYLVQIVGFAGEPDDVVAAEFDRARLLAKVLFTKEVGEKLDEIQRRSQLLFAFLRRQRRHQAADEAVPADLLDREEDELDWLSARAMNLPALFGAELHMSDITRIAAR